MKNSTYQLYTERILKVLIFIQKNLDEELSLDAYARVAHFSPYHFHRIFRGMVGESLHEHIRRLRLERAATRLKRTRRSIIEIALEAGYNTHEAFTRAFRALCGCSPSHYRRDRSAAGTPGSSGVHYREDGSFHNLQLRVGGEPMEVRIEHVAPLRVAFVRHVGPYNEVETAWERLCMHLGKDGLLGPGTRFIGICYDDPEVTAPEKIRYDACVTVDPDFVAAGEIGVQTIGGGEYAVTTHLGPYSNLGQTYAKLLGQWLPRSGRELRSEPSLEFYLNAPESTDPEDLITDIYAPLEPAT
ncbi:MAG: AraC family transcriptional regulator [Planctomycetes bacterium]|nr:AraC family transcriptional regulator [Planctomycetota bacterium]